jgi:hypothetical protein
MRQENPVERYGMARYDVANRKPRGQEGTFQARDGNQARDEARAAARETTAPTFAELQSQGRARPSPMMANVASSFAAPTAPTPPNFSGMGSLDMVRSANQYGRDMKDYNEAKGRHDRLAPFTNALGSLQGGSGGPDDSRWTAIMNNLEAQFGGQRARLNEDLARRGLWASTGELGAGARLGDLEGQQSRALASARADYQLQQDDRYDRLMQMLLPLILGG